ncbi:cyanocobalamin reductase / alkylcobalamin dealkylase-like [Gigantopelta aegis]|uniref:cyanocobalamin reductase / alkylcobalamin dealkylase-like n=1 Tax=Gigantopelta aegis TaxID=1735272 RepID=UPI001B887A10|nr:cyanocobalamin reductase / alkylcobalamin dealkylase-like [Gigantopelta aegis]
MESKYKLLEARLNHILSPLGFEFYPFKVGWYNEKVGEAYVLPYNSDTLAFSIISTPDMFEKTFKPFIFEQDLSGTQDPIDQCMIHHFNLVKQEFPEEEIEVIHDFEMTFSRRPKVLLQTAGHVSGAAYYYRQNDLKENTWPQNKKMLGVIIHPKYGGWFAFRTVVIFKNIKCPDLEQQLPEDCVPTQELRKELFERFNFHWQDWSFRDIIAPVKRYSEEQKLYFQTLPKDRHELLVKMKKKHMCGD